MCILVYSVISLCLDFNITVYNSLSVRSTGKNIFEVERDTRATKRMKNAWEKEKVRHFHLETHPDGSSPSCSAAQNRTEVIMCCREGEG